MFVCLSIIRFFPKNIILPFFGSHYSNFTVASSGLSTISAIAASNHENADLIRDLGGVQLVEDIAMQFSNDAEISELVSLNLLCNFDEVIFPNITGYGCPF